MPIESWRSASASFAIKLYQAMFTSQSDKQTNLTLIYWIHVFRMFYMKYACILGMYNIEFW